jgi:predicted nucleotidyltransferase
MTPEIANRYGGLEQLCHRYRVRRLELFGSAARGEDRPDSDLDFLVEFEPLPRGAYADSYFGLLEALEHLFGKRVDLIVTSTIGNPYLREFIERTKRLVYAA